MTIKTKLLVIPVGLVMISIVVIASFWIYSIFNVGKDIQKISGDTLRNQAEKLLIQFLSLSAEKNDLILEKMRKDAGNVAEYADNIFANPETFARGTYWRFDDHIFRGDKGQHLNGKDDISAVFIPNYLNIDGDLKERVELSAYLDYIFPKVLENEPSAVAIYIIGPSGESRYYPNIGLGNIAPPDLKVTEEIFFTVANPKNNPERKVIWTPVYDDPAGQGLIITASAPIYTEKGFLGVLGIDIALETIIKNIEESNAIEGSYSFLVDRGGRAIALPERAYHDILGRPQKPGEYGADLNNITNEFSPILKRMKEGSEGFDVVKIADKELYVAYTPLKEAGFSIGGVVEKNTALKSVSNLQKEVENSVQRMILTIFLPSSVIILFFALALAFFLSKSISNSLIKLRDTVIEVGRGNLTLRAEIKSKDEIGQLAASFNEMVEDVLDAEKEKKVLVEKYTKELEQTVEKRTLELQAKVKEISESQLILQSLAEDVQQEKETVEIKVKQRTRELKEEQAQLLASINSLTIGFILCDLNNKIILKNPSVSRILAIPESDITIDRIKKYFNGIVDLERYHNQCLKEKTVVEIKNISVGKKFFRLMLIPVIMIRDSEEIIGHILLIEDITGQKKLDKMRTEIVSITSHQLRTPSTVVKGNLEMILEGDFGKITEGQREILNETYLGNERMINLINDLMDVTKIDEGRFELKPESVQLKDLAAEIVKELLPFAKEKKVSLSFVSPLGPLPKIKIDRQRMKQTLLNLVVNALKYSSQPDKKNKVLVTIEKDDKFLKFIIKDNGIGVPKDEQDKIFSRFVRGSNVVKLDPGGGSGLGLYIAKAIIKQSGGKIWFESEENKGTTFFISLPI